MPGLKGRQEIYRQVWREVRDIYREGHCMTERGLQSALYMQLRNGLERCCSVVVEPKWERNNWEAKPDLVIVENECITDIFEIKWAPNHRLQRWRPDIQKLREYVRRDAAPGYQVSIDPTTGTGDNGRNVHYLRLHQECQLHFVGVSRDDDPAGRDVLPELDQCPAIHLWRGPVGPGEPPWCIKFGAPN